jgi:N-acetyltransferase
MISEFEMQPHIAGERITLRPLIAADFEKLYAVASDPLIWEQHPNKNRYKRDVFATFFEGALQSGGAFLVLKNETGEVIGSSRFYDFNAADSSILIGYTFLARNCWGTTYNRELKTLMLNHAFRFVERVYFHIGAQNIRSQKAIERLGAEKTGEQEVTYYGETPKTNFVYCITKTNWEKQNT